MMKLIGRTPDGTARGELILNGLDSASEVKAFCGCKTCDVCVFKSRYPHWYLERSRVAGTLADLDPKEIFDRVRRGDLTFEDLAAEIGRAVARKLIDRELNNSYSNAEKH